MKYYQLTLKHKQMKSIKLTEQHKSKLLEMCKALFPANKTWRFYNPIWSPMLEFSTEGNIIQSIHWFEFCMTHLVNVLAGKKIKTDMFGDIEFEQARIKYLTELAKDRVKGQYHPVDYLYKHFKKYKK